MARWFLALTVSVPLFASLPHLSDADMRDVVRMARIISIAQPKLNAPKYFEYGFGVIRASKRYNIDPLLLIAITYQESAFREGLPEGEAGEIGLCQIRKAWLENPGFRKEFGHVKEAALNDPVKSLKFAAWILKRIASSNQHSRTLPFWCYYNSKQFENRLTYYLNVNRRFITLKRLDPKLINASWTDLQKLGIRDLSQWRPPLELKLYPVQ